MKKSIIAIMALFTISLASCKKDYVCQCSITRTSGGNTLTTEDDKYTFKDSRVDAEKRCSDEEGAGSDAFGEYTRNCEIK